GTPLHFPVTLSLYTGLFPIIFADLQPPSQNICLATVDLNSCSHYLLAALHNLRLAEADLSFPFHALSGRL
ncbi:hypothetical protein N8V88_08345, partial [Enterobacter hormaechei subsp. oharae]|nr:hypothetical protein [Enterobacter hormaechei subsp. oharae]